MGGRGGTIIEREGAAAAAVHSLATWREREREREACACSPKGVNEVVAWMKGKFTRERKISDRTWLTAEREKDRSRLMASRNKSKGLRSSH